MLLFIQCTFLVPEKFRETVQAAVVTDRKRFFRPVAESHVAEHRHLRLFGYGQPVLFFLPAVVHHHFGKPAVVGVRAETGFRSGQGQTVEAVAVPAVRQERPAVCGCLFLQHKLEEGFIGQFPCTVLTEQRLRRGGALVPAAPFLPFAAHGETAFVDGLPQPVVRIDGLEAVLGQLRPCAFEGDGGYRFQCRLLVSENQPAAAFAHGTEGIERLGGVCLSGFPNQGEVADALHFGMYGDFFDEKVIRQCIEKFFVGEQDAQSRVLGGDAVQFFRTDCRGFFAFVQCECKANNALLVACLYAVFFLPPAFASAELQDKGGCVVIERGKVRHDCFVLPVQTDADGHCAPAFRKDKAAGGQRPAVFQRCRCRILRIEQRKVIALLFSGLQ